MPDVVKHVFVSYSHEDKDLTATVFTHLRGLDQHFPVKLWIDAAAIRVGDRWQPEIDRALEDADLAVLLISPAFLASKFITEQELPRLLGHRDHKGLRLVPILLKPCAWPRWLAMTEIRPRGDLALSEIAGREPARVDRALQEIVKEIAHLLDPQDAGDVRSGSDEDDLTSKEAVPAPIDLLTATLLADAPKELHGGIAARLVGEIGRHTGLAGGGLYDATRLFVEWALLRADDPTSPHALEELLASAPGNERARAFMSRLRQGGRSGDFSGLALEVNSTFFGRTNERSDQWRRYFEQVVAQGASSTDAVMSLVPIRVTMGFLAPQFLVAGLLARLDDDWRPVLNAYQRAIPNPRHRNGAYQSLQASQWNCWLLWGPSIPICTCVQWRGTVALQYGYGDENNSVPVLELAADDNGVPKTLGPIAASLAPERRGAKFAALTGRLRWGPWFLRPYTEPSANPGADEDVDIGAKDHTSDEVPSQFGAAAAQRSLYHGHDAGDSRSRDGLVFQLERVDDSQPETRVYFSSYLWLMFLVAGPSTPAGLSLLNAKAFPAWVDDDDARQRSLRDARMWQDLLPVFVHANIADPSALAFQRQALVDNALNLLRQLWQRRTELFDKADVDAGIHFYLVCGSDYGGCGCGVRFPPAVSLLQPLRARLAAEPDAAFAASVMLPSTDGADSARPDALAGFFSACHLPELIAAYYEHVSQAQKAPARA